MWTHHHCPKRCCSCGGERRRSGVAGGGAAVADGDGDFLAQSAGRTDAADEVVSLVGRESDVVWACTLDCINGVRRNAVVETGFGYSCYVVCACPVEY
ncbi:unnamed protein product [Camellia sinensis]